MHPSTLPDAPARWEVEWRVIEVFRERVNPGEDLTPQTRLVDVGADSLDMIELIMILEETFNVRLDERAAPRLFTRPATLGDLAAFIESAPTSTPRPLLAPATAPPPHTVPFTQLGGAPTAWEWLNGPLHEPLGRNAEGQPQLRRRTDGMRCVLLADAGERPFLVDAEPVSNQAFARFLNAVGALPPTVLGEWCGVGEGTHRAGQFPLGWGWGRWWPARGAERQPTVLVSWYGANAYSLWANRQDWRYYRADGTVPAELVAVRVGVPPPPAGWVGSFLPSESQWEHAARGGDERRYPWGDEEPTPELACVGLHRRGAEYTAATLPMADVSARLGMSPFGLHHMAGNVWQWCQDWYSAGIRSERGGSWVGGGELAGCAYRRGRPPLARGRCLGFRCAGPAP